MARTISRLGKYFTRADESALRAPSTSLSIWMWGYVSTDYNNGPSLQGIAKTHASGASYALGINKDLRWQGTLRVGGANYSVYGSADCTVGSWFKAHFHWTSGGDPTLDAYTDTGTLMYSVTYGSNVTGSIDYDTGVLQIRNEQSHVVEHAQAGIYSAVQSEADALAGLNGAPTSTGRVEVWRLNEAAATDNAVGYYSALHLTATGDPDVITHPAQITYAGAATSLPPRRPNYGALFQL